MTTINEINKIQINYTVRRTGESDKVLDRSTMVNIRCDSVDEACKLYDELRNRLNGEVGREKALVVFEDEKVCPKCSSELVLKTARNGKNAGNQFWACSGWPNCRYSLNA